MKKKTEADTESKKKKSNTKRKKLTQEEKDQFDALYRFVKSEILQFDENVPLSSSAVLRLKGLNVGKYIDSYSVQAPGAINEYGESGDIGFDVLLTAFKVYKGTILQGFTRNHIEDTKYKLNYACKIVESHIQEIVDLMKKAETTQETIDRSIDFSTLDSDKVEYKKKPESSNFNPFLEDLWK